MAMAAFRATRKRRSTRRSSHTKVAAITTGEWHFSRSNCPAHRTSSAFTATDTNGDGSVSLDEFSADPAAQSLSTSNVQQLFSLIDSNGDGSISQTESSAFLDQVRQAVSSAGGPQGAGAGSGAAGSAAGLGAFDPISQLLQSSSTTDGDTDNSSSGASASPTAASSTGASSTGSPSALDLLLQAANAYSGTSQQPDLVSMLSSLLQTAA